MNTPLGYGIPCGVQIWLIWLDREPLQTDELVRWLSADETARSERFRFPEDRKRFVVCRAALRSILGARLDISPADVRFDYGEYGKPSLSGNTGESGLHFNVAHSRGLGCIAVASGRNVGVDVEAVRQLNDLDSLIRKTLARSEQRHIAGLPASDRLSAFFRYWTMKEALLKVVGVGLQWPLRDIELDLGIAGRIAGLPANLTAGGRLLIQELDLGDDHCGALATESDELPQIEYRIWRSGVLE
jgi:4'-phosphopantetheinyl transferase